MSKSELKKNQAESIGKTPVNEVNEKLEQVSADFEKEAKVNLDRDRLTYICDYCGKVNGIDRPRCTRCGKRRPRSEYIKAINAIREAKEVKEDFELEKASKEEEYIRAEKYLQEKKEKMLAEKEEIEKLENQRKIEEKVAEEKSKIHARESERVEQEREQAKKMAARDAVLQIIAAEKYADEMIHKTKKEASEAILDKESEKEKLIKEYNDKISAEREKAMNIAAEKLVAQRSGIENFAMEQIKRNKEKIEKEANEKILAEREQSEKMAARRAVLQIIAAEKANDDELKNSKEALSRAALKRIEEERETAKREANSRFLAERQGIEKAAEERIRAEREAVKNLLEEKKYLDRSPNRNIGGGAIAGGQDINPQTRQVAQPFVIVPYVNSKQPLLQYKPNQVYRFVPNTYTQQIEAQEKAQRDYKVMTEGPTPTEEEIDELIAKKSVEKENVESELDMLKDIDKTTEKFKRADKKSKLRVRLTALFTALFILGIGAVLWFMPLLAKNIYSAESANVNIFTGFVVLLQDGINGIIGSNIALVESNSYVEFIRGIDFMGGVILPLGLFIAVITYALFFIKSIIRLISGRARTKGLFLSILGLVFVQITVAGIYLLTQNLGIDFINNIEYSIYAFEGLSLLILIAALINKKNKVK